MNTIYALSSASGIAGVSVIRISGGASIDIAKNITGRKDYKPRFAYFDKYFDGKSLIDEGLTLYFKAPYSFTGEDVVEFQVHGSPAVISKIFEVLEKNGAVLARPGEFSKRAFYNNKMDLIQAQGLIQLINSETESQRKLALSFASGDVSKEYQEIREAILKAGSLLESYINFYEDEIDINTDKKVDELINYATKKLEEIVSNPTGDSITKGYTISLIGEPNAGKSSIFNALLNKNKAIVSNISGTTRDVVEAVLDIGGYKVILSDTAGLRESKNKIEKIGIKKAKDLIKKSDLKLYVVDKKIDKKLIDKNTIILYNKSDKNYYKIDENISNKQFIISTKNKNGIKELKEFLKKIIEENLSTSSSYILNKEHKNNLKKALNFLRFAYSENQADLKAQNLIFASNILGEIIGVINLEDVLDKIFSNFCVGK